MNDLITVNQDKFIFSGRDILTRAGVDKKNLARTLRRNIVDNEILDLGVDYIKTQYIGGLPSEDTQDIVVKGKNEFADCMLTKKAMELVLISLRTKKANQLRKELVDKMNQVEAQLNPRQTINEGLKLAYALIEADKERQKKEKETELLVLKAKGKRAREEVITKINELARKIGMELNNGNIRAVYARMYRCFAANNKRWYWGNAMQAKNHLEYIGEMGGVSDLRELHDILVSFVGENKEFFAQDEINSKGEKRCGTIEDANKIMN